MKPTIPEVLPLINRYIREGGNDARRSFHIVLDDGNVADNDIKFCINEAKRKNDKLGVEIGERLLLMSKTQRLKIGWMKDNII